MPEFLLGEEVLFATQLAVAVIGAYFMAFWLGLVFWTYKDIRSRSRDIITHLLAVMLVIVFNLPGILLYLLLRPLDTISQRYERSLEEEAILHELDQSKLSCPSCRRTIEEDFLVCPFCQAVLKRGCSNCGRTLNMAWRACPYCTAPVAPTAPQPQTGEPARVGPRRVDGLS